jgi:hypothetical protein
MMIKTRLLNGLSAADGSPAKVQNIFLVIGVALVRTVAA